VNQTLLLVRHGQASAGSDNYDRLSDRGREQSRYLGQWWRKRNTQPAACFHGTLERQRDTKSLVLEDAGIAPPCSVLPDLDEYNHRAVDAHLGERLTTTESGAAPVNPESMSYADYATIMRRWRDSHSLPEALEDWPDFAARGWNTISSSARQQAPDATLAYFTSGGIISTVLATVLDLDFDHCIDAIWRVRNASVTTLAYDGRNARLVEFNNVTHLDLHHDPELVTLI
jgi:broad specificity phosphatase PhoE